MSLLSHPYIVPLVDFFEEEDTYYIVKERMSGSDILERVGNIGEHYNEGDVRGIIANVLKAVSHCHSHNIAHRDINAKNILLTGEESNTDIKLTGFALAARCHEPKSLTQQCGTPFFAAPEVLTRKPYDQEADLWAIGCFAFLLLSGTLPFVGQTQKELFRNIVSGKFEFDEDYWGDVSVDARAFVKKLLVVNPGKRLTADAALKLLWMQVSYAYLEKHNLEEAAERIKTFYERMTPKHAD
jgi:serine/threonine protein kinase